MKPSLAALLAGILTFLASYYLLGGNHHQRQQQEQHKQPLAGGSTENSVQGSLIPSNSNESDEITVTKKAIQGNTGPEVAEVELLEKLRVKLQPKQLRNVDGKLIKHQFLHLHHMKTGGTSMDGLIGCAMNRIKTDLGLAIDYMNIHECSPAKYQRCVSGQSAKCMQRMRNAAFLSYCAPLKDLHIFDWGVNEEFPVHALTVLRHPVDRVWSMYRFQTKACYGCKTLKEVYESYSHYNPDGIGLPNCVGQLMNHQTRNMLTTVNVTNEEKVEQAISDMHNFFTFVGLTEDMPATATMVGKIFPWLAEHMNGTVRDCPFPHKNSSPSNNGCGPGGTHMPLPDHPDEETVQLIIEHNQMDMKVYEAAVELFELQKKVLLEEE